MAADQPHRAIHLLQLPLHPLQRLLHPLLDGPQRVSRWHPLSGESSENSWCWSLSLPLTLPILATSPALSIRVHQFSYPAKNTPMEFPDTRRDENFSSSERLHALMNAIRRMSRTMKEGGSLWQNDSVGLADHTGSSDAFKQRIQQQIQSLFSEVFAGTCDSAIV